MTNFLDSMKFPEDLKYLSEKELEALAQEIRTFLTESVSKTGGHLASNLGVVELTLSLFRSYNVEKDKIIWDVGHQSYVHKILTGRKECFDKLRTKEGISGFPKRNESKYDIFDTGHSSTSISAALGIARARDINNDNYKVVAVIGDGALTGGMALEALNDVGFRKSDVTIVLNDNQMSINKNVGGIAKYLNTIRIEPGYNRLKNDVNTVLNNTSIGKTMVSSINKIKGSIKQLVVPSMLFENMGIRYVGPIDGHDIHAMIEVFSKVKDLKGPVLVHVVTKKGKGYKFAEESPDKFHGIGPFEVKTGEILSKEKTNYSKEFGKSLIELASENSKIVAITAAMPSGTGLVEFAKRFKNRFFDVGIAEEHAVTLAAGMACGGLKPVFAVYSTFLQRAYDQIVHDVCIQNIPVVFAIDRAGVVGADGETHQGIMDLSYLSMIPNMTIVAPKCTEEIKELLHFCIEFDGPIAIRYPRGGNDLNNLNPSSNFTIGKWEEIVEYKCVLENNNELNYLKSLINKDENLSLNSKVAVIATGKTVEQAVLAKEILKSNDINIKVINATFIKPVDTNLIQNLISEEYDIITVEDNLEAGGLGDNILRILINNEFKGRFINLSYKDKFVTQATVKEIYEDNMLDAAGIVKNVIKLFKVKEHV